MKGVVASGHPLTAKAAAEMLKDLEQRAELEIHAPDYQGDGIPCVACGDGVYHNLRAALEAEHDEPVTHPYGFLLEDGRFTKAKSLWVTGMPLYTHSPAPKPLTDDEIKHEIDKATTHPAIKGAVSIYMDLEAFARAIERKHGIGVDDE